MWFWETCFVKDFLYSLADGRVMISRTAGLMCIDIETIYFISIYSHAVAATV